MSLCQLEGKSTADPSSLVVNIKIHLISKDNSEMKIRSDPFIQAIKSLNALKQAPFLAFKITQPDDGHCKYYVPVPSLRFWSHK